jgi:hypothetical protein
MRLTLLQTGPYYRRSFIQPVIALVTQIEEHCFAGEMRSENIR